LLEITTIGDNQIYNAVKQIYIVPTGLGFYCGYVFYQYSVPLGLPCNDEMCIVCKKRAIEVT